MLSNPFLPHRPHPKQALFLLHDDWFEGLYGGAAGGAKSDALLMAAAQYGEAPGYAALLLRENFPDLNQADALIPRSKAWWAGKAHWNDRDHRWTFPSGATITFGYLERDDSVHQYQSSAFQFIGVDELTQHTEFRWTYLASRIRKPSAGPLANVPLRPRGATNPGGPGHEWVKQRFLPAEALQYEAGDDRFYARPWYTGDERVFVPARLEDNPSLDLAAYERNLSILDPVTRSQLRKGDWKAHAAGRFRREWFRRYRRRLDVLYLDDGTQIFLNRLPRAAVLDPANRKTKASKFTAMGAFGFGPLDRLIVLEVVRERMDLPRVIPALDGLCARHGPILWAGIEANGFQLALANEAREQRYRHIPTVWEVDPEGKGKLTRATPAILRAKQGKLYVPYEDEPGAGWVEPYIAELCPFTGDEREDSFTDQVDITAYAVLGADYTMTQVAAAEARPFAFGGRRNPF